MKITNHSKIPKYKLIQYLGENHVDDAQTLRQLNKLKKLELYRFVMQNYREPFLEKSLDFFEKYDNPRTFNFEKRVGLRKLTKKEKDEYHFDEQNYDDPYRGKAITLENHQKKFLMGFFIGNLRGSIVFHGVGTGKTFTAVASSKMYLQLYPKNKVIFLSPPSVIYNFIEAMAAYGLDPRDPRYSYFTYDKFYNSKRTTAEDALLIVDEAHNFRTEISMSRERNEKGQLIENVVTNKKGYAVLLRGGMKAHKVILLTATPFINKTYDIENLLAIAEGRDPIDESMFGDVASNTNLRFDYFKYKVSHYEKDIHDANFPERRETFVCLVCPESQERSISATAGKDNPFYIHTRQESSTLEDLKVKYVIDEIKSNKKKKFVCYTTFQVSGYVPLEKQLKKNNIDYAIISGKVSTGNKKYAIDAYNNYDFNENNYMGQTCRVLIITKAGAEGVNLKRTNTIFIMDGQWNDSLYEQIVARAIRFKSHDQLPKKDRYVNVKKLFVCKKSEKPLLESINTGKPFDYVSMLNKILEKRELMSKLNKLKKFNTKDKKNIGIKKDDVEQFLNKIVDFGETDFDDDVLNKFKKGSKERREYLSNNKSFAKNKDKYITSELTNILDDMPSTDFYMFLLQKNKQTIINAFIKQVDRIPSTEKSIVDLEYGKQLFKKIEDGKLEGQEMMKLLIQHLRPEMNNLVKLIYKQMGTVEDKLLKFLETKTALKKLQIQKNIVKISQEYFTPEKDALELFKLSGFEREYKSHMSGCYILEPTAGHGALIAPIVDFVKSKNIVFKIDMVEFSEDNRKVLEKIQIPNVIELQKTRDFLEFNGGIQYHFIFMNPPFHLDKSLNKKYKKDYYDYDFVMRAYALLELNGVLVAITGTNYRKNKMMIKWYDDKQAKIQDVKGEWSGINLKEGANIQNLHRVLIYIRKLRDDEEENNKLLKQTFPN